MSWVDDVSSALGNALGGEITYEEGFGPPTFDVPSVQWIDALAALKAHGFDYFDWLTAVDELEQGFAVACHLAALRGHGRIEHVLVRTRVDKAAAALPTATGLFAGASWHERETHEMFGIGFDGHPGLAPLLLPDEFEGHPLRKDFILAARVAKAWPGAKEPGESDHDTGRSPSRRRVAPPGVPGPDAWGPREPGSPTPDPTALTAPARPARRERPARGEGERPVRERPARRQPPASQPADGTDQPAGGPDQPQAGSGRRSGGGVQSADGSAQSADSSNRPPTGSEQQSGDAVQSADGGAQSAGGTDQPPAGTGQQSGADVQPAGGTDQRPAGSEPPVDGTDQPPPPKPASPPEDGGDA